MVFSQPNKPGEPSAPEGTVLDPGALAEAPAAGGPTPPPQASPPANPVEATLAELQRVVWPSRQQLISESLAVLLMVTLSAAAIASLDRFFHWLSMAIFR
ncbi:MAG: preprotein translocase subunit SecE [Prochlorococcaceae cyanobacterium]